MKAIITRRDTGGGYDSAGMNNRSVTKDYQTRRGLLRAAQAIADSYMVAARVEIFRDLHDAEPMETIYLNPAC